MVRFRFFYLFTTLLIISLGGYAQTKVVRGLIKDSQSEEAIPFASIILKSNNTGTLTDSAGNFTLNTQRSNGDTLLITSVGYKPVAFVVPPFNDSVYLTVKMDIAPVSKEAVVKVKFNRALWFWNRIIKHKKEHDLTNYDNYSYEIYNKIEVDMNNVNVEKLSKNRILKPFGFILKNVDSSEDKPVLPLFLTETLSDFYFQRNPKKVQREVIKASKTNGIGNESVTKLLGGMYQNINVYHNYIPVFDKDFVSPFHDNGDNYYNFKLLDTQYLANTRLIHLSFKPRRKGENTFEGDCWVDDKSYAIQKVTLRPAEDANVNFLQKLTLIQEYRLINDSIWFLSKDKFVADLSPLSNSKGSFKGRKTTTYRNIIFNQDSVTNELKKNEKAEQVIVLKDAEEKVDTFWTGSRHEELSKNERAIYKMIDTIQTLPAFKKYYNTAYFLTTGLKTLGNYEIGPWYNWISANSYEGTRVRFDLGTSTNWSKKWWLHGYLAYGFKDKGFKGLADVFYLPKKNPRTYFYASYLNDMDYGQSYYDEVSTDNIFSVAFRKAGVPSKFQRIQEKRFEAFQELKSGFSFKLAVTSSQYDPLRNLPDKSYYERNIPGEALNNFQTSLRIRYAYLERYLETTFLRSSLGSEYPIVEFTYSKGWAGVLKSSYNYQKVNVGVSDYLKVPPYGNIYYNVFAGKIFGTLPFQLLEVHPGNEIYYYNKYAFNLMNRFEYISDRYAGFNVEHNIGNGIFKYVGITRKLKFRQFWSAKGLIGSLSQANQQLNFVGTQNFRTLDDKMYLEVGTGVDNILKVLRVDFIWRLLPQPLPKERVQRFGIFGSFRFAF